MRNANRKRGIRRRWRRGVGWRMDTVGSRREDKLGEKGDWRGAAASSFA